MEKKIQEIIRRKINDHLVRHVQVPKEDRRDRIEILCDEASKEISESLTTEIAELRKQLTWIPVAEKLPEFDELVLFAHIDVDCPENNWAVAGQINSSDGRAYNQFQDMHSDAYITPTHWLPIPQINNK